VIAVAKGGVFVSLVANPSLPGLTRQSIFFKASLRKMMDARIIPDQVGDRRPRMTRDD
jgi:hypothetical protein